MPLLRFESPVRGWERGPFVIEWQVSRFVVLQTLLATKRKFREFARCCPLTLALSPNTKDALRERVDNRENAAPGLQ